MEDDPGDGDCNDDDDDDDDGDDSDGDNDTSIILWTVLIISSYDDSDGESDSDGDDVDDSDGWFFLIARRSVDMTLDDQHSMSCVKWIRFV